MMNQVFAIMALTFLPFFCLLAEEIKIAPNEQPKQGLIGSVYVKTGNWMPPIDPNRAKTIGLSVPVHIFKNKIKPFAGVPKDHPAYICSVKSDKSGIFVVVLPPGRYTIVIEYKGGLISNGCDQDGFWSSVEVKEEIWSRIVIMTTNNITI